MLLRRSVGSCVGLFITREIAGMRMITPESILLPRLLLSHLLLQFIARTKRTKRAAAPDFSSLASNFEDKPLADQLALNF